MDYSLVEEIMTCGICLKKFNGDSRCPRILTCGHSFCHSCLEKLIEQNPRCHTCDRGFRFRKAVSIPINFSLERLTNIKTEISSLDHLGGETIWLDPIHFPLKSLKNIKTEVTSLDHLGGETIGSDPINFPLKSLKNIKTEVTSLDHLGGETIGSDPINFPLKSLKNIKTEVTSLDLIRGETIWPDPINFPLKSLKNIKSEVTNLDHIGGETICSDPINFHLKSLKNIKTEVTGSTMKSAKALDLQERDTLGLDTCADKRQKTHGLSFLSEGHYDERKSLIEELKKKEQELKNCDRRVRDFETIKSVGRKFCKNLEQLHDSVGSLAIGNELSKAIKELEKLIEEKKTKDLEYKSFLRVPLSKKVGSARDNP
ncbi:unnamed protein product [Rotaria magnacalcarata]|uniref:RING-type domain-containing protein n=1 Tax=Rotaria magnacalcarata TaxID=392030 RepID=A0A816YS78_9BILA|nr:unnamed protein product [Rotaria magnacalcarata]CAF4249210.1 unnamed protein product [Rotaria magnacalcarata]